jgi:hypothetical protein
LDVDESGFVDHEEIKIYLIEAMGDEFDEE